MLIYVATGLDWTPRTHHISVAVVVAVADAHVVVVAVAVAVAVVASSGSTEFVAPVADCRSAGQSRLTLTESAARQAGRQQRSRDRVGEGEGVTARLALG